MITARAKRTAKLAPLPALMALVLGLCLAAQPAQAAAGAAASGQSHSQGQATTQDSIVGGLNQVRSAAGQAQLPLDPLAERALADVAAGSCPSGCSSVDAVYRALGGRGTLATALVDGDPTDLAGDAGALALAGDPRATGMAQGYDSEGDAVLAVALDQSRAVKPLLVSPVDFGSESLAAIMPAASGQPQLAEYRGGKLTAVSGHAYLTQGANGAVLVSYDDERSFDGAAQLAYGAHYRLTLGSSSLDFTTPQPPAAFLAEGWHFDPGFSGQYKALFLKYFSEAPPLYRQIAQELDGAVAVKVGGCGGNSSCAGFDGQHYYISMKPAHLTSSFGRFATMHEFGHITNYLGIDDQGMAAFRQLFSRSPQWPYVEKLMSQGLPFVEVLADQFAFWATGDTKIRSGYDDPPLCSRAAFGRVLKAQFAFRPEPGGNPVTDLTTP